jgi:hypothetical protein
MCMYICYLMYELCVFMYVIRCRLCFLSETVCRLLFLLQTECRLLFLLQTECRLCFLSSSDGRDDVNKPIATVDSSSDGWMMSPCPLLQCMFIIMFLLAYFIDIAIYTLGSMPWSSRIFWMVVRVRVNPSLGLSSPYWVVPQVPIIITMIREGR